MGNGDDDGCPFCQIVKGSMDAHVVDENEDALAILDINPVSKGHTLVIPKEHGERITDLSPDTVGEVFKMVRELSEAAENALDPRGINVLQSNGEAAGQEVHHMHVHVIPRYRNDGLFFSFDSSDLDDQEAHEVLDAVRNTLE